MNAGSLGFSVVVYAAVASLAICLLLYRRNSRSCGYAELGGPESSKRISAIMLALLWLIYVSLSALQVYRVIQFDFFFAK